jgi:UDP-glucose 4,6-dehydratase
MGCDRAPPPTLAVARAGRSPLSSFFCVRALPPPSRRTLGPRHPCSNRGGCELARGARAGTSLNPCVRRPPCFSFPLPIRNRRPAPCLSLSHLPPLPHPLTHSSSKKTHHQPPQFIKGDIQSADLLNFILPDEGIDTVMHFAAQTHVDNSFGNSLAFTLNNTYGTHVLLEAARVYGRIRRFIAVSTDEVYGESSVGREDGCNEASTLEPTNPYSAAKAGAEMMVKAYGTSYRLPCIITRGNNVYGPHQFPEKLVPKFTLLASRGADLPVHGDGGATRSYLYVADVAAAFETVLLKGKVGETYNIGTQKERSVLDVARDIAAIFGADPDKKIVHVRDRAFNDQRYFICDKKLGALGWKETTPWEEGLRATVDWYLKHGFGAYWEHGDVENALRAHPGRPA